VGRAYETFGLVRDLVTNNLNAWTGIEEGTFFRDGAKAGRGFGEKRDENIFTNL